MTAWRYLILRLEGPYTDEEADHEDMDQRLHALAQGKESPDQDRRLSRMLGLPVTIISAEQRLNKLGTEGWELVSIFKDGESQMAVFKKPETAPRPI